MAAASGYASIDREQATAPPAPRLASNATFGMLQRWPILSEIHPDVNFMPRLAGNLLAAPAAASDVLVHDSSGLVSFNTLFGAEEVNQSWSFTHSPPETIDLAAAGCWRRQWAAGAGSRRIVLAALPQAAARCATASFLRLGRALNWSEGFDTFDAPAEIRRALERGGTSGDWLPAGLAPGMLEPTDSHVLNMHWKYGDRVPGGAVEAKLAASIASLPTACLRLTDAAAAGASAEQSAEAAANRQLVSWVCLRTDGSLGVMHTLPSWRGRGLGAVAVRLLTVAAAAWRRSLASGSTPEEALAAAQRRFPLLSHALAADSPTASAFTDGSFEEAGTGDDVPLDEPSAHEIADAAAASITAASTADPASASVSSASLSASTQAEESRRLRALIARCTRPYCHINPSNTASVRVFEKLGYKPVNSVVWMIFGRMAHRIAFRPLDVRRGRLPSTVRIAPAATAGAATAADADAADADAGDWGALERLVNASYLQDDAFFVDMVRTDRANLESMAREGVFYLGYAAPHPSFLLPARADPPQTVAVDGSSGLEAEAEALAAASAFDGSGYLPAAMPRALASCFDPAAATVVDDAAVAGSDSAKAPAASPVLTAASASLCDDATGRLKVAEGAELLCAFYITPPRVLTLELPAADSAPTNGSSSSHESAMASDSVSVGRVIAPQAASGSAPDTNGPPLASASVDAGALAAGGAASDRMVRSCHIGMLVAQPHLKRCGLGQRLLDTAVLTARKRYGADAVDCHVVSVKPWLRAFYERNGFAVVGRDEWPAALVPQLKLPQSDVFFHRMVRRL